MRKIIAALLCLCILLSALPTFAASEAAQQVYSVENFDGEIIIPVTETEGTWKESTAVPNYNGGAHIWSNTKGDTLIYKIKGIMKGNYEVYNWVLPHKYNSEKMNFVISHNGKTSEASVYQKLSDEETVDPGWVSMGVFDFAGDSKEKITHVCTGGNSRATAIKLVPTKKGVDANESEPPKSETPDVQSQTISIDVEPSGECYYNGSWRYSTSALGPMTKAAPSI